MKTPFEKAVVPVPDVGGVHGGRLGVDLPDQPGKAGDALDGHDTVPMGGYGPGAIDVRKDVDFGKKM